MHVSPGVSGSAGSPIPVVIGGNSTVGTGSQTVTTAGTRVQLSLVSVPCKKVIIQSMVTNTGNTYVGDVAVSSTSGLIMYPGGASNFILTPSNLNLLYIDSAVNGEGCQYYYEN